MIKTITKHDFQDAFRGSRPDDFSYDGLNALFDYLEEFENDTGEQIELDVIALCCEFSEYEDIEEITKQYQDITTLEELENNTTVIQSPSSIIIQDF